MFQRLFSSLTRPTLRASQPAASSSRRRFFKQASLAGLTLALLPQANAAQRITRSRIHFSKHGTHFLDNILFREDFEPLVGQEVTFVSQQTGKEVALHLTKVKALKASGYSIRTPFSLILEEVSDNQMSQGVYTLKVAGLPQAALMMCWNYTKGAKQIYTINFS